MEVQLRLGVLSYTWVEDAAPAADGMLSITLHPPAAAFVHPLAEDYVSDLALRVVGLDASGRRVVTVEAPAAYLAWPAGATGAPAVWDGATMAALAPYGVVDPVLRGSLTLVEAVDRVFPPLYGGAVVDETPAGDE